MYCYFIIILAASSEKSAFKPAHDSEEPGQTDQDQADQGPDQSSQTGAIHFDTLLFHH